MACRRFYRGSDYDGLGVLTPDGSPLPDRADLWVIAAYPSWRGGDGAERLALSLLAHHTGDGTRATYHRSAFARRVVSCLPESWRMDPRLIDEFVEMRRRECSGGEVSWGLWRASVCERGLLVVVSGTAVIRGN